MGWFGLCSDGMDIAGVVWGGVYACVKRFPFQLRNNNNEKTHRHPPSLSLFPLAKQAAFILTALIQLQMSKM